MNIVVIKRDGTEVPFDVERIKNAIFHAVQAVGGKNKYESDRMAYQVAEIIEKQSEKRPDVGFEAYESDLQNELFKDMMISMFGEKTVEDNKTVKWHVEEIQDIVEKILIENGHATTAKEYILYRQRRTDARNMNSLLSKTIDSFVVSDASDDDEKRENANIDGDSTCGIMLKVGGVVMKDYVMRKCMKEKHALMHRRGEIHYHEQISWS